MSQGLEQQNKEASVGSELLTTRQQVNDETRELNSTTTPSSSTTTVFQVSRISNSLYNSTELYAQYRPEVGVRTAGILGSILFFIVFYLLWRNRCRCSSGQSGENAMTDEIIKTIKQQQQDASMMQLLPPTDKTDSRQATEAWIIEHRNIWNQRHRQSRNHNQIDDKKSRKAISDSLNELERQSVKSRSKVNHQQQQVHLNTGQNKLLESVWSKFKRDRSPLKNRRHRTNEGRRGVRVGGHASSSSLKLVSSRSMETGGVDTQLLINYARIDAIDASVINFNKITGGIGITYPANTLNLPLHEESSRNHNPDSCKMSDPGGGGEIDLAAEEFTSTSTTRQFISHFLTNLMHRRRSSWPRCKSDHLQLTSFARDIRLFYQNSNHVYSVNETDS